MTRRYMTIGAILSMLGVIIGAFGAHALKDVIGEAHLKTYETGVQYHMIHALGILLVAVLTHVVGESPKLLWGARLLLIGIILFSGSLYVLATTGVTQFGYITPLGGLAFIAGWILIAIAGIQKR
jgi:uncharacterized membrane protein YgdD (TMEM256/DUF423 family)